MSKKLTLKEELEILRGETIHVFTGDPLDIPCIETSDPERLCKHPVVSVNMLAYNHESYIRQAIEGVMMQKTDFEFELVIGEDCSTDKTREICFEYQKRYPDRIRVLWCDHNLYRNPHPAGGNYERNLAHCRGEFIALCEGDDYWIDPIKLQKQVDVMRSNPSIGLCFTHGQSLVQETGTIKNWWESEVYAFGLMNGRKFFEVYAYGKEPSKGCGEECFILTASLMIRKEIYDKLHEEYEVFNWKLVLGDKTLILGCSLIADVFYLQDLTVVYRRHGSGAMATFGNKIYRDSAIVKLYFSYRLKIQEGFVSPSNGPFMLLLYYRVFCKDNKVLSRQEIRSVLRIYRNLGIDMKSLSLKKKIRLVLFFFFRDVRFLNTPVRKLFSRTVFMNA